MAEQTRTADAEPDYTAQTESYRQQRAIRRSEIAEDYVGLIADLVREQGEARQVDIAARLGVAQPTVAKTLKRLTEEGLVTSRPYRGVFLTDAGRAMADDIRMRHEVVKGFLTAIGVSAETAARDAEGIEHHVSDETLEAFRRMIAARP